MLVEKTVDSLDTTYCNMFANKAETVSDERGTEAR